MRLYSNEIVFRGHPDKVCDQISAAILKECVRQDKDTHAGIEVAGGKGKIFITGEITTKAEFDSVKIARRVLADIGYPADYEIIDNIGRQSPDINQGVSLENEIGAGDQGMMFGYACSDTIQHLPTAMVILQRFSEKYDELRKADPRFKPDGKAQITGVYNDCFKLMKIRDFVISYNNTEEEREKTDKVLIYFARKICADYGIEVENFHINPTGKFLIGGFEADAGVTGRKIVVDAYQSFGTVGGGNFNGKDCSKVDFSAAHKARELAVRCLEKHNLRWCQVQISYAIGMAKPLNIYIDSDVGFIEPDENWYEECKPKNIIRDLGLLEVDYEKLAYNGHFKA